MIYYVEISNDGSINVYGKKELAPIDAIEVREFPQQTKEGQVLCFDEKSNTLYWADAPISASISDPSELPPSNEELAKENAVLSSKLSAAIKSNTNLEECIVEMANIVYA